MLRILNIYHDSGSVQSIETLQCKNLQLRCEVWWPPHDGLRRGEPCGVIKYFILTDQICSVLLINATRWLSHFTRQNIYLALAYLARSSRQETDTKFSLSNPHYSLPRIGQEGR